MISLFEVLAFKVFTVVTNADANLQHLLTSGIKSYERLN